MDIATIIGVLLAAFCIYFSIYVGGASLMTFYDLASIFCVIGGGLAAVIICFPMKTLFAFPMVSLKVVLNKQENLLEVITTLVGLAETARRDGLLALEGRLPEIKFPLIRSGLQMAVDGSDAGTIESVLRSEIEATSRRHKDGKALMDQLGKYAPAYGMIGTLLGLVMMLSNMSDPSSIGAGMAVALLTTLYGAVVSNVFCLPAAEKLGYISKQEMIARELMIRGILAIQSGESPRALEQRLMTFVPPKQRPKK
jgi:chemotaxis protein MotA